MTILGIETSCDETAAAIIEAKKNDKKVKLISNVVASSLNLHSKTGGIIPEVAARQQIKYIIPVIKKALLKEIDAIAVTYGPGLIGSLLVGVETAKTLSYVWKKPIIPVNHLIGHIYANFIDESPSKLSLREKRSNPKETTTQAFDKSEDSLNNKIVFPALALVVSGGHTDLVLLRKHESIKWLGGTRDDAAGEAFDKIGRLLGLPYPGGPFIEKSSKNGNIKAYSFPRPMIDSNDFDFSFSGLKTAVLREVQKTGEVNNQKTSDISASVQKAVIDVLTTKTLKAAKKYKVKSILLSGGVAANQKLRDDMSSKIKNLNLEVKLSVPPKYLCTDNAAMIATAAFFNYRPINWNRVMADPELYF